MVKTIAIIGGCQVVGLSEASRRFLPDAEVSAWHFGVHPADTADELLEKLKGFDLVISQIADPNAKPLLMDSLKANHPNAHFLPTFVFPGFHPDLTYLVHNGGLVVAPHTDFHSKIAVAAFLMGYDVKKTQTLYNAMICSELGYFDAFAAAKAAAEINLKRHGYAADGVIDHWLETIGAFMYMSNHPHIVVLTTLLHQLYTRIGLIPADTALPVGVPDNLGESFCWPVYPALAKRAGVEGSMTFKKGQWLVKRGETRDMTFTDYMGQCFELYAQTDREKLETPVIKETRAKLEALFG